MSDDVDEPDEGAAGATLPAMPPRLHQWNPFLPARGAIIEAMKPAVRARMETTLRHLEEVGGDSESWLTAICCAAFDAVPELGRLADAGYELYWSDRNLATRRMYGGSTMADLRRELKEDVALIMETGIELGATVSEVKSPLTAEETDEFYRIRNKFFSAASDATHPPHTSVLWNFEPPEGSKPQ